MRHKIWKADDYFSFVGGPRIDMDPEDVVEIRGEPMDVHWGYEFVHWGYEFDQRPIGSAGDIRIENGEITAEIEWFEEHLNDETIKSLFLRLGGYYTEVKKECVSPNREVVTSCVLRGVAVFVDPDEMTIPTKKYPLKVV